MEKQRMIQKVLKDLHVYHLARQLAYEHRVLSELRSQNILGSQFDNLIDSIGKVLEAIYELENA